MNIAKTEATGMALSEEPKIGYETKYYYKTIGKTTNKILFNTVDDSTTQKVLSFEVGIKVSAL